MGLRKPIGIAHALRTGYREEACAEQVEEALRRAAIHHGDIVGITSENTETHRTEEMSPGR